MAQPNNFGFGEEAALLKDSARKFFEEKMPTNKLHTMVAGDPTPNRMPEAPWDKDSWQQMVELGWTMVAVPEAAGGIGMPVVAVAGLAEELGRAAFPCPLLSTINCTYVLSACGAGGEGPLEQIAQGLSASLATVNRQGSWSTQDTDVTCSGGKLKGTAWFVQDVRKVDKLLVSARGETGVALYWVDINADGVSLAPDAIIDLTRDQGHVSFNDVDAVEVCADGAAALDSAFPAIWTVAAADMVGAGEWLLQTTVDYVSTRKQFEHPLGFFQAVKHPLVDVMVQIDQTKSLVYNAACAIDCEPENASKYAHMAKASASETAAFSASRAVQYHGGIGFTWECYVHLYFKRQKHSQLLWGDAQWHREQLAEQLMGPVAA
jgi:alkylation response protein AidB-like acyl-CoA dehydrogenase